MIAVDTTTIAIEPIAQCDRSSRREREVAATCRALESLTGATAGIGHDPNGAPVIEGRDEHISISHSRREAVVAIDPTRPIGIDVEEWRDQLTRIQHKFLNPDDAAAVDGSPRSLLFAWTVKEATYKLANRSGLSLRDDITILTDTCAEVVIDGAARRVRIHPVISTPERMLTLVVYAD